MACVDFETHPILAGAGQAPVPVGVSILLDHEEQGRYLSWGHPGANNCTWEEARRQLAAIWDEPLLFHNCKFDIAVAMEHMDLPWPANYDDTMFMLFLNEPHARSLSLKPSAERLLGMAPDEQTALFRWLQFNFKGPFISDHKTITKTNFGAYIAYAPLEIVEPYANGDTLRTRALARLLQPVIVDKGMEAAYKRELRVARIGYAMERRGVPVDRERLLADMPRYERLLDEQLETIHRYLGDVDPAKRDDLAEAIEKSEYARPLPLTPSGKKLSTAKGALEMCITEPRLLKALRYHGALHTLTKTFFKGWLAFSERDGRVHPSWNQVRSGGEGGFIGARTGRFSCSDPNLTNVPTEFDEALLEGLELPMMREYLLAPEGMVLVPGDYNGQEMRILAHYAEGKLLEIYQANPHADIHTVIAQMITELTGHTLDRRHTKAIAFALIYGSGIPLLAKQLKVDTATAQAFKDAYFKALPGLKEFMAVFRFREQVRTWGGRVMPVEEPKVYDGRLMTFNYKLTNYLIQGSAADQGKEAMIRYDDTKADGELMLFVHDELVMAVPEDRVATEVPIMRTAMEGMAGWDVPFKVEFEQGRDWHNLKGVNDGNS